MTRTIELWLRQPRHLLVADEEPADPFDPRVTETPAIDRIVSPLMARWPWEPLPRVIIHLPACEWQPETAPQMQAGLMLYGERRLAELRDEWRGFLRTNIFFLLVGVTVSVVGLLLNPQLAEAKWPIDPVVHDTLQTGLDVLIWVALWAPISAFIHEWYPYERRQRAYEALARTPIEVRSDDQGCPNERGQVDRK
ncbi:MAG TPA: hypothetical protein VFU81_22070 [Thermomicrobiales bacterium]|nr:hypothetical protein [Thermomicrobiales bacterium]